MLGSEVGVNAFGYAGLLLGRDAEAAKRIAQAGPMEVLRTVGVEP